MEKQTNKKKKEELVEVEQDSESSYGSQEEEKEQKEEPLKTSPDLMGSVTSPKHETRGQIKSK